MRRLRRFFTLTRKRRWLISEAIFLTAVARVALLLLPFRWIARSLGRHMNVTSQERDERISELLRQIHWAVAAASRHVPWQAKCLAQAMVARVMLGRRGACGTIYLGVAKDRTTGKLTAHAWLRCGNAIVTGHSGMRAFTPVSTFAFGRDAEKSHV